MGTLKGKLRERLTYANVVSTLCLFLLLGGTAAAVDGSLPGQNTVGSEDVINGEVKYDDLGANSVGSDKIINGKVKNPDLGPGAADTNTIRDNGVRSVDVRDDSLPGGGLTGSDIDESTLQGLPGAPPTGPAGGALAGSFPDPSLASGAVGAAELSDEVRARRIDVSMSRGQTQTVMTLPGGTTVEAECYDNGGLTAGVLSFKVAADSVFDSWLKTFGNFAGDYENINVGESLDFPFDTRAQMIAIFDDGGSDFATAMGTFVLTSGARTFTATAAAKVHGGLNSCTFSGAVTPAT
jgi:hypothetical protein